MSDLNLLDEKDEMISPAFTIDTMEKADWALRRIGREMTEVDKLQRLAIAMKMRIDGRLAEIVKPRLATIETMEAMLKPWASVEIAKQGKAKSYKLLSGVVGFRSTPERLEVQDEAAAVAWAKTAGCPDLVRVKEEVKKTEMKKRIQETGELPDGVALIPGEVRFYADPVLPLLEGLKP